MATSLVTGTASYRSAIRAVIPWQPRACVNATDLPLPQGDDKIRFKYDAANNRWKRITAEMDETDKYTLEKWEEGGVGIIKTKTGGTYTVLEPGRDRLISFAVLSMLAI